MHRIIATFTEGERNLIVFVLITVAAGFGILEWRENQYSALTFDAASPPAVQAPPGSEITLPAGLGPDGRIDVNTADSQLLETLPGIGPSLAGAITRYRQHNGLLGSMEDLDKVPGIGPAMMTRLAPMVSFGNVSGNSVLPPSSLGVPPSSTATAAAVDINNATAEQLDALKGVGPALARRIIENRRAYGPFKSVADLDRVKGIGPKILQQNTGLITVGPVLAGN